MVDNIYRMWEERNAANSESAVERLIELIDYEIKMNEIAEKKKIG